MKIKDLRVKVTYTVGLGDIEVPEAVVEELKKAAEKGRKIDMDEYGQYEGASQWLQHTIHERDSMEWAVEIEDLI